MPSADRIKVLLIGQGPTAKSALEGLADHCDVLGIVRSVRPDDADQDDALLAARERAIPVYTDTTPDGIYERVVALRPSCVVVSSYDRILSEEMLALTTFVNVHYALLPCYRGRANVNWAILNGETHTGISIHRIAPGLDAGAILFQAAVPIGGRDTVTSLYQRLNTIQRCELPAAVARAVAGHPGVAQDPELASYGCSRVPDDGLIDWSLTASQVDRLVRGLAPPFPGAFTFYRETKITVTEAEVSPNPRRYIGAVPGRVVSVSRDAGYVDVLTGEGTVRIHKIRPDAGEELRAAELIRSTRDQLGLTVLDLLRRIQRLEERVTSTDQ
ncbi:MAG: methionyl-tRNA formyltransferase [Armatimonadota bacterium]